MSKTYFKKIENEPYEIIGMIGIEPEKMPEQVNFNKLIEISIGLKVILLYKRLKNYSIIYKSK